MFLRSTHQTRFKNPSHGIKKAERWQIKNEKKSKSGLRELSSRPKSTKSTGIALGGGGGARAGVFENRPYRFSNFTRFRPHFAKFRRKSFSPFSCALTPWMLKITHIHTLCMRKDPWSFQAEISFSQWENRKKTEILGIVFHFSPLIRPQIFVLQTFQHLASKSRAFFRLEWREIMKKNIFFINFHVWTSPLKNEDTWAQSWPRVLDVFDIKFAHRFSTVTKPHIRQIFTSLMCSRYVSQCLLVRKFPAKSAQSRQCFHSDPKKSPTALVSFHAPRGTRRGTSQV